jgi:hypothetical protein
VGGRKLQAMNRPILSAGSPRRQTAALVTTLALVMAQGAPARYTTQTLGCAAFQEQVRIRIRSQTGSVVREESAGRDGVLVIHAVRADSGFSVEAWYDSLSVWREGPEGRIAPETDGLVGGRWRGWLSDDGRYRASAAPFIPDDISEIAELNGLMDDFLPRLPGRPLGDGERYAWTRHTASDTTALPRDTVAVPVRREIEERGVLTWDRSGGPMRWERTLRLTVNVRPGGVIRRGMRSVITEEIRVTRVERPPACQ